MTDEEALREKMGQLTALIDAALHRCRWMDRDHDGLWCDRDGRCLCAEARAVLATLAEGGE